MAAGMAMQMCLKKVNTRSDLGNWSYEVVDTKLARETKGGTILQLCLYSELVEKIQGLLPVQMHIITPLQPEIYRTRDYLAYHHFVKLRLENAINTMPETYPEPVDHCDICSWWPHCDERRRDDDHLSFVAGISKLQIRELHKLQYLYTCESCFSLNSRNLPNVAPKNRSKNSASSEAST